MTCQNTLQGINIFINKTLSKNKRANTDFFECAIEVRRASLCTISMPILKAAGEVPAWIYVESRYSIAQAITVTVAAASFLVFANTPYAATQASFVSGVKDSPRPCPRVQISAAATVS